MPNISINVTIPEGILASLDRHAKATEKARSAVVADLIREARPKWESEKESAE